MKCPLCKTEIETLPKKFLNKKVLLEALKFLTPRDYTILYYRIVLGASLTEVCHDFTCTKERILELEIKALRKLLKWFKTNCDKEVSSESIIAILKSETLFWPLPPIDFIKDKCFESKGSITLTSEEEVHLKPIKDL